MSFSGTSINTMSGALSASVASSGLKGEEGHLSDLREYVQTLQAELEEAKTRATVKPEPMKRIRTRGKDWDCRGYWEYHQRCDEEDEMAELRQWEVVTELTTELASAIALLKLEEEAALAPPKVEEEQVDDVAPVRRDMRKRVVWAPKSLVAELEEKGDWRAKTYNIARYTSGSVKQPRIPQLKRGGRGGRDARGGRRIITHDRAWREVVAEAANWRKFVAEAAGKR